MPFVGEWRGVDFLRCKVPWETAPYGVVSLLDMLRFHAQSFVSSTATIVQIVQILNRREGLTDEHLKALGESLGELMRECARVDLPMTLAQMKRIKESIGESIGKQGLSTDSVRLQLNELANRMWDELDSSVFYQIESSKSRYYEKPNQLWGEEVSEAFPSAVPELTDAAKCYGLERNTACVFHLMRALEIGLSCMAKPFGVSADHTNWHNVIEQVESKVRDLSKTKPNNWKEDQEFYSQAASYFMILKDAWRNYTAHRRGRYEAEEAKRIMENVCGFMGKLATRLKE